MPSLLAHLHKQHDRIQDQTVALTKACRKKQLHAWRVRLKKWRYALQLLGKIDEKFPLKKILKPYKVLFSAAGNIREVQIQRDILRQSAEGLSADFLHQYRLLLQQQYRATRNQFIRIARETSLPPWNDIRKPLRTATRECNRLALSNYFHQLEQRMEQDWNNRFQLSEKELHDLRKRLKAFDAAQQLVATTLAYEAAPPAFLPNDISLMMEQVGLWHDYVTAMHRLRQDLRSTCFSPEQRKEGRRLLRRWQKSAGQIRESFHNMPEKE